MKAQLFTTMLVLMGFGSVALAQEAASPEGQEEPVVLPDFKSVDANTDGMIDTAESEMLTEILAERHGVEFQFETVDENEDGLINSREYIAYDAALQDRLGIG